MLFCHSTDGKSPPGRRMPPGSPSLAGAPAAGQPCRQPPGRRTANVTEEQTEGNRKALRMHLTVETGS
jgi:hypothetical protein